MPAYEPASYTATGGQTDFVIPFSYISEDHVTVTVDDVAFSDYTIVSGGTIVRFDSGATNGDVVLIARDTPITTRLVDFENGAGLPEDDLDTAFNQLFYVLEEFLYNTDVGVIAGAGAAAAAAAEAAQDAQAAAELAEAHAELAETNAETAETNAETAATSITSVFDLNFSGDGGKALVVNSGATAVENRKSTSAATGPGAPDTGVLWDGVFQKMYIGTAQAVTASGDDLLVWTHGLGGQPHHVTCYLICTTIDGTYEVGDIIVLDAATYGAGQSVTVNVTTTTISIGIVADATPLAVLPESGTQNSVNLTEASWSVYPVATRWIA